MATRETRLARGRRQGVMVTARLRREIRAARVAANLSQGAVAATLGWSRARFGRFEADEKVAVSVTDLASAAAVLGLEVAVSLHPSGEPIADKGHQALIRRFLSELHPTWRVAREVPLPIPGDRRSWDVLLRLESQIVGVEAETRIRDVQALVRRVRERERDGGADRVLLVLANSAINRRLLPQLTEALGVCFGTSPRRIRAALRAGAPLPGSGIVLA